MMSGKDVTSSVTAFQVFELENWENTVPTVDCLTGGTKTMVPVERSDRLLGRLRILARAVQDTAVHFCEEV